jgi:hypothetical protein
MGSLFGGPTTNTSQQGTQSGATFNTSLNQGTSSNQNSLNSSNSSLGAQQGSNSQQFSNTSTPNLPAWYSTFLQSLPGQYGQLQSQLTQNSQQPLYGPQQQAAFQQNLNQTQGAANQTLQSQLASQGALNSGRASQMDTQLALGGQNQLSNYLAQVPQLNAQNSLANTSQLGSLMNSMAGFTSPVSAYGTTQSGTQNSLSSLLNQLLGQNGSTSTGTAGSSSAGTSAGTSNGFSSSQGSSQVDPNVLGGLAGAGISGLLGALTKT